MDRWIAGEDGRPPGRMVGDADYLGGALDSRSRRQAQEHPLFQRERATPAHHIPRIVYDLVQEGLGGPQGRFGLG